ncbi:MAG: LLM class flavin-dependent oxidoreductase [Rhodospirillaceae bacterium]|nr:LLM class flavin-dependent oxidoreductase [Rhodospirillaceae bacterium]
MKRQLHLNLFIQGRGSHEAAWRHPLSSTAELTDINYYQDLARRAEAGLFDSIFFADQLTTNTAQTKSAKALQVWLEPITMLAAIAVATTRIGLIATGSSTYTEPFNLARQFASVDHISQGRAGWNIVTSWMAAAARNFGDTGQLSHSERYTLAEEHVQIVKGLWDSWADDTIIDDRQNAVFANTNRIRPIDFKGKYFNVAGPFTLPRGPQGHPVLVQAGSSEDGRGFAARHAEAVFTAHIEKTTAQAFYSDMRKRVAAEGRRPDQVLILPGLCPTIASTEAEAKRLLLELSNYADVEIAVKYLGTWFGGHDFSHLPLDRPLTVADFPDLSHIETSKSRTEMVINLIQREDLTLRELLARFAHIGGHYLFAGTAEQVADLIEDWFLNGAADGFNLMPPLLPSMLDIFIDEVVPLLQRRGLFRTEYQGTTLREHYGLQRPPSAFA